VGFFGGKVLACDVAGFQIGEGGARQAARVLQMSGQHRQVLFLTPDRFLLGQEVGDGLVVAAERGRAGKLRDLLALAVVLENVLFVVGEGRIRQPEQVVAFDQALEQAPNPGHVLRRGVGPVVRGLGVEPTERDQRTEPEDITNRRGVLERASLVHRKRRQSRQHRVLDREREPSTLQAIEIDEPAALAAELGLTFGQHTRLEEHPHHGFHQARGSAGHTERGIHQLLRRAALTLSE
jgi:hypothetical protein